MKHYFENGAWHPKGNNTKPTRQPARLTAAAPDLLAALEGVDVLYTELSAALPLIANTPAFDRVQAAVKAARAAIARATGK